MLFSPEKKRMWDTTVFCKDGCYHIFYLCEGNIGHVRTEDFAHYTEEKEIEGIGKAGSWNQGGLILTGCLAEQDGKYKMLLGSVDPVTKLQVYGLFFSDNLRDWKEYENNPVLKADGEIYDDNYVRRDWDMYTAWRDPKVYKKEGDYYYLCMCSRLKRHGKYSSGAAVANLRTKDFINYEYLPPLCEVGNIVKYAECPDCFKLGDAEYITFLDHGWGGNYIDTASVQGAAGTFYFKKDEDGKFKPPKDFLLIGNSSDRVCAWAARTALDKDGNRFAFFHVNSSSPSLGIPKLIENDKRGLLILKYYPIIDNLKGENIEIDCSIHKNSLWKRVEKGYSCNCGVFGSAKTLFTGEDIFFECKITLNRGKRAGIFLWRKENEAVNFYLDNKRKCIAVENLALSEFDGFGYPPSDIVDGGRIREIDQKSFKVKCGKTYSLKIIAKGGTVDIYLDDIFMLCKHFKDFKEGEFGLFVNQAQAVFSDISVNRFKKLICERV